MQCRMLYQTEPPHTPGCRISQITICHTEAYFHTQTNTFWVGLAVEVDSCHPDFFPAQIVSLCGRFIMWCSISFSRDVFVDIQQCISLVSVTKCHPFIIYRLQGNQWRTKDFFRANSTKVFFLDALTIQNLIKQNQKGRLNLTHRQWMNKL